MPSISKSTPSLHHRCHIFRKVPHKPSRWLAGLRYYSLDWGNRPACCTRDRGWSCLAHHPDSPIDTHIGTAYVLHTYVLCVMKLTIDPDFEPATTLAAWWAQELVRCGGRSMPRDAFWPQTAINLAQSHQSRWNTRSSTNVYQIIKGWSVSTQSNGKLGSLLDTWPIKL